MNTLYIAWQDPQTRAWHTVGKLTKEQDVYCFVYTQGAKTSPRFNYLGRMFDLTKRYYSRELFPLFANRILNKSRAEYPDYLRWLALDPNASQEPMQLLARSGGKRATDELCVYPHPERNEQGQSVLYFLSHGLRYLDEESLQRIENLQAEDYLILRHENNSHDEFALLVETQQQPIKVGYCPRYLNRDLGVILKRTAINLSVARLNHDAPLQFRLLCKAEFNMPIDYNAFTGGEYQVLAIKKQEKPLELFGAFDSDKGGNIADKILTEYAQTNGVEIIQDRPPAKDWNETLTTQC